MATPDSADRIAGPATPPSRDDALAAVTDLERDSARLAQRLPTGRGGLLLHAALFTVFVGAEVLPGNWAILVAGLAIMGVVLANSLTRRRLGIMPAGPLGSRATWLFVAQLALLLAAKMAATVLSDLSASPWWSLIPVAVAFVGVLLLGDRYHRAMRQQLVMRASGRS